ncbi:MAG: hypothetical protein M0R17_02305 [Candidatus Omnitrophica bacterium]|nr:hypothetical protein [Candidatus Omnitrophota bacterium]
MVVTKHFYPDCMVVIVPGFQSTQIDESQAMVFSNTQGSLREITSISVNLTVANSPGTFNITLSDTANKFILPDDPVKEIGDLYTYSKNQTKDAATDIPKVNFMGANYYEFDGYDTGENAWLNFAHASIEDEKGRYPVYFRRDLQNNIVECWAFTYSGEIIKVAPAGVEADINDFLNSIDGDVATYDVVSKENPSDKPREFTIHKSKNSDFNTKYRDIEEQGEDTKLFLKGKCRINPMDRIVIFMSKRFETGKSESTAKDNAGRELIRVFTGFVNTVQQGYSENNNTVTIQGEDVTKMMRLSVVNVNPSLDANRNVDLDRSTDDVITLYTDILKGLNPPEIVKFLTVGGEIRSAGGTYNIKRTGSYELAKTNSKEKPSTYVIDVKTKLLRLSKDSELSGIRTGKSNAILASFKDILGELFSPTKVHIINPFIHGGNIEGFRAYEKAFNSGNYQLYQNEFKVKRDVVYQIAEDTAFTFYADRDGEVWYCPPRYNNTHILTAENPEIFIIRTEDIISYGFIEDDAKVFSSVTVSTEPDWEFAGTDIGQLSPYTATFKDENIMLQYGQRIFTYSNPLINTKGTYVDNTGKQANLDMIEKNQKVLQMYAKNLLQKMMAENRTGQITITGRAELPPGYPIYIPIRNMIYYVESVDHSLSFGNRFETTLHLSYGRKPWENIPEILYLSSSDPFGAGLTNKSTGANKIDVVKKASGKPITKK